MASRPTSSVCDGRERVAPVEHGPEAAAGQVLEHQEGDVAVGVLAPVVDGHDVGVVERRGGPGLGLEAAQEGGVVGQRVVQHLHRDAAAEAHVVGEEHLCGRATADRSDDPVAVRQNPADLLGP